MLTVMQLPPPIGYGYPPVKIEGDGASPNSRVCIVFVSLEGVDWLSGRTVDGSFSITSHFPEPDPTTGEIPSPKFTRPGKYHVQAYELSENETPKPLESTIFEVV